MVKTSENLDWENWGTESIDPMPSTGSSSMPVLNMNDAGSVGSTQSGSSSSFDWGSLMNMGSSIFSNWGSIAGSFDPELRDDQRAIAEAQARMEMARAQGMMPQKTDNTKMIIGVIGAVVIAGLIAVVVLKKK